MSINGSKIEKPFIVRMSLDGGCAGPSFLFMIYLTTLQLTANDTIISEYGRELMTPN
jgi:hypothetical protein